VTAFVLYYVGTFRPLHICTIASHVTVLIGRNLLYKLSVPLKFWIQKHTESVFFDISYEADTVRGTTQLSVSVARALGSIASHAQDTSMHMFSSSTSWSREYEYMRRSVQHRLHYLRARNSHKEKRFKVWNTTLGFDTFNGKKMSWQVTEKRLKKLSLTTFSIALCSIDRWHV
jgi:hypothetical protein